LQVAEKQTLTVRSDADSALAVVAGDRDARIERTGSLFSFVELKDQVPKRHPLRKIREIVMLAALNAEAEARGEFDLWIVANSSEVLRAPHWCGPRSYKPSRSVR